MCSYTSIYNYVHSTMYISLVDQDYWDKDTQQIWKRIKPFNNILIRLNLTNQCKEYFMSFNWDLIWTLLQVVALLIIAREIDKRIRKRKNK